MTRMIHAMQVCQCGHNKTAHIVHFGQKGQLGDCSMPDCKCELYQPRRNVK